ncbi:MAG: hypothetical protein MUO62_18465, partial [Anaerolineales bacterium]|nr:hypothetical protein [Anaerolineales bacterium]
GHVFTYSERPGTAAAHMPNSVPYPTRKFRNAQMRERFMQMEQNYQDRFIGKQLPILWERARPLEQGGWTLTGLSDNYLRVSTTASRRIWNQINRVEITNTNGKGLVGRMILDPKVQP